MLPVLLLLLLGLALLTGVIWQCTYWRRHGIEGPHGWPFCGNMLSYALSRESYGDNYARIYNCYKERLPYVGIYRLFNEPALLLCSQPLLKEILIRNFQHFEDNALCIDPKRDPIIISDPFVACGEHWRQVRAELLPLFTPTKVKQSFPHIDAVCARLATFVDEELNRERFEAKQLFVRYTLDVVASAGFGLSAHSFSKNRGELHTLVEQIFEPTAGSLLETIALLHAPNLGHLISYRYVPLQVQHWLRSVIGSIMKTRRSSSSSCDKANDFLQCLMEAQKHKNQTMDEAAIVGHCSTILLEGYETSASLLAHALYEYAVNVDVQQKLHSEIDTVLARFEQRLCHEALTELTYMDATLYETLRMHPIMMALFKKCTKPFELPPQRAHLKGQPFTVPRGMVAVIPVKAIHFYHPNTSDETLYPEPARFIPERFATPAVRQRLGCRFLGFGEGARMCPGLRFGLAQSKAALVTILRKYRVQLANKAPSIAESRTTFLTVSHAGVWLRLERRL